ncbi:MAG TPA: hypothetical protein VKA46_07660 [Gemmataceae bacterium]|nr:hypothetical protein [Gemmataceae bacterium]
MLDRVYSVSVALGMASLVWLYARSREQEMLDNVPVPVQIALAPGEADHYSLEVAGPAQVPVSFAGPPSRLRELRGLLQRGELRVDVTLAVPEAHQNEPRYHDTVRIDAADIHPPSGVTPILVEGRNRVPVTLHRLVERRLPVRFDHAAEDQVGQAVVEPPTVLVRGPQEVLDHLRALPTQPFVLPAPPEGTAAETVVLGPVPLASEAEGMPVRATPDAVTVRLTLQPKNKLYEVEAPIHFLCPSGFPRRPRFRNERDGKVTLRLLGPASEEAPKVSAYIDLTAPGKFAAAGVSPLYDEPLQVQLPTGFQLAQPLPRFVAFELAPPEAAVPPSGVVPVQP